MKKIRVAIDAKWYFDGNPSGRVVVKNIVDHIDKTEKVELIYFVKSKHRDNEELSKLKGKIVFVWGANNMVSNIFVLPIYCLIYRVDVILFQYFPSFLFWKKQIAFVHDIIFLTNPKYYTIVERIYLFSIKYLVKLCSDIVTVSEFEKQRMLNFNFGNKVKKHVVYHGVSKEFTPLLLQDIEKVKIVRELYSLPEKYILFVGRLNVRKNISNLLKAFKIVTETRKDYKLVVVGNKDWKTLDVDSLIMNLGIEDSVKLLGGIYGSDLPFVYSGATIFCFPSYDESFGLPPLEAMASGVPVIVSNRSSLPEICGDSVLYADPDDYPMFATHIINLLENEKLRKSLIEKGINRASFFTWDRSVETLLEIFLASSQTE